MAIKLHTRPFGEIEIEEKQIIDFPEGILGFDFVKRFAILDDAYPGSPFRWMQAVDEPTLAFVIILVSDFIADYELDISQGDYEAVGAKSSDELLVFAIVTIPADFKKMTANLMGPIIINPKTRIGKQAISISDKYGVRHLILEGMKRVD
ncbi:MAG: flagellar assembly protein FliW [Spirochaetes bacterium]|nr:flagellar assembly protein FliW [Spirochaetota bacterium]